MVEIKQEDREAADAWRRDWMHCQGEHTQLVQAFARHRIAHTRSQSSDSVVEAIADVVAWLEAEAEERGKKTQDGWALHWAADRIAANEHRALAEGAGK